MKKTSFILGIAILFIFFFATQAYALDMNLINSIRENELNSAQNLSTNTLSNNANTNSPGINLDLTEPSNNSISNNANRNSNTANTNTNNSSNTPTPNNSVSSITDLPEASLGLANILNILLLVVGVLLILLGIAIIIKIKK